MTDLIETPVIAEPSRDQIVGDCAGCYWLLESTGRRPWCVKFEHLAGKLPGCTDWWFIPEDDGP